MKSIVVKYPVILSKSEEEINKYFDIMASHGIKKDAAMNYLLQVPKLLSEPLETKIKETIFVFELYHKMTEKDVFEIFRAFPYLFCLQTRKIQLFLGQFKKYRFTHKQIKNVCMNSGGLLGCKVGNFKGLFDVLL
jgi:hypothetical protein